MADISYDEIVRLAEQLPRAQQVELIDHLLKRAAEHPLTTEERLALLEATVIDLGQVAPDISMRREDWYGDDGR
jgi:hypothetical protein